MSGLNLSALAVRERAVTLFLLLAISVAGVVAFFSLGRAEDPSFTIKQMTVVTVWPGATAKEMEELVAERLEKRMQELRWYDRTETFTRPGLAFTMVVLRDTAPPADVPEEFYQARKKLGDEAAHLPPGVIGPLVNDEYSDVTFALYALKAKGEPHRNLIRDAEGLRQRLLHVPGVKKVNIIGEQAERIFVEVRGPASEVMAKLRATPGVMEVRKVAENDGSNRFQVEGELRGDIRSDLARTIVQSGWGLLELQAASMSLEDIFLKLTREEEGEKTGT